jgi:beta-lysine 5,6-aminomutase alpha subunit
MAPSLGRNTLAADRKRLLGRARELAASLSAAARSSTTLGRERAILRLIGVNGIDREGRPLAAEVVDRYVDGGQDRLASGIGLPFAVALLEYESTPQALALDVAAGVVDLGLEAQLLDVPARRAAATEHLDRLVRTAIDRVDANRVARRELLGVLGDRRPPWIGTTLQVHDADAAESESEALIRAGLDLVRVEIPAGRELATRLGEIGQDVLWRPRAPGADALPAPAGSQRGLARLREVLDRSAAERGAYVRLAIAPTALAVPEGAIVAAFERADLIDLDPMGEIVVTGVDPERALADFAFALRVARRSGTAISLGAGPLVVAPDLDAGINSDPATRSGRALALQLLAAEIATAAGMTSDQVIVGSMPAWLTGERDAPARAAAEVALRRALLPGHPMAFAEPPADASGHWHALVAALMPGTAVSLVLRRMHGGTGDPAAVAAGTRAASEVAADLAEALVEPVLRGMALEHATGAIDAALTTLEAIGSDGWLAITGATATRGGWGRLGGEAVAPSGEPGDPVERALA